MSVLNTMLSDLERRGQRPALSLAPREEAVAAASKPAQVPLESTRRKLPARLPALLAAAVAAAATLWLWPRHATAPAFAPDGTSAGRPANHAAPALANAGVPAPLAPLPAAAVVSQPPASAAFAATAGQPAEAVPGVQAGEPPSQPMHPHTLTPRARQVPVAAASQTAVAEPGTRAESAPASAAVAQSAAQSDLARAMALAARGRTSEAVQLLEAALSQRPAWNEARSTLAALQAEAGDRQQALATLLAGVAFDSDRFAPTAAQLQAELGDPIGALQTLDRVAPEARDQTYHALAGAVAQRAGQHERAVTEYGAALRFSPSNSLAWVGLGVSLQALGRDVQALAAYRAAAVGKLSADLQRFVQARIGAVQGSTQAPAADPP